MSRISTTRYHSDLAETQLLAAIYRQIMKLSTEFTSHKFNSPIMILSSIILEGDEKELAVAGQKVWPLENCTRKTRTTQAPSPLCLRFHPISITQLDPAPYFWQVLRVV
jgi:hypothetical protein